MLPLIYYKIFAYILSFICCKNYLILILNLFNLIDGPHQADTPQAYHYDANKEDKVHACKRVPTHLVEALRSMEEEPHEEVPMEEPLEDQMEDEPMDEETE